MAADFNKPTVSGEYTDIPTEIRDNFAAAVTMHESDASSNKPTGAKQITAGGVVKRWDGSAWITISPTLPTLFAPDGFIGGSNGILGE